MKKLKIIFIAIMAILIVASLVSCKDKETPEKTELATPANVTFNGTKFTWSAVEHAKSYKVKINGTEKDVNGTEYTETMTYGTNYEFQVKAVADEATHTDSKWSEKISHFHENVLFKKSFTGGTNNDVFMDTYYGAIEESAADNSVILKAEANGAKFSGPNTYFGEDDKNLEWKELGMTVLMKIYIDKNEMEENDFFNITLAVNNKTPSYYNERSLYFRKYADAVKVGYMMSGSDEAINLEATGNAGAVTLETGWYVVKYNLHTYDNAGTETVRVDISLLKEDGTVVFDAAKDQKFVNGALEEITPDTIGGIRYLWLSAMSEQAQVKVSSLKIIENY